MMRAAAAIAVGIAALAASVTIAPAVEAELDGIVTVPPGPYTPFLKQKAPNASDGEAAAVLRVEAFRLDAEPVTNAQFLAFVTSHPRWRKSQVKAIFADARYLRRWPSDLEPREVAARDEPVTNVSWFAAEAYCKARGLRLPTTDQWEYALADAGRGQETVRARSLEWFAKPNGVGPPAIGEGAANGFGVKDMVGFVWEWTLDFDAYAIRRTAAPFSAAGRPPAPQTPPTIRPSCAIRCGKASRPITQPTISAFAAREARHELSLAVRLACAWSCGRRRRSDRDARRRACAARRADERPSADPAPRSTTSIPNGRPRTTPASPLPLSPASRSSRRWATRLAGTSAPRSWST